MGGVKQEPTVELWVDDHNEYEPGIVTGHLVTPACHSTLDPATTSSSVMTRLPLRSPTSSAATPMGRSG